MTPLTIGACVNNRDVLLKNLLASPELAPGHPHQVILVEGATSAADGMRSVRSGARNRLVMLAHQDVWFPNGALADIAKSWDYFQLVAEGRVGVLGVAGVADDMGLCMDVVETRGHFQHGNGPSFAHTLDEIVLVVDANSPQMDERLGWHLYGSDLCLRARSQGKTAAISPVQVHHNTSFTHLPDSYWRAAEVLAQTWSDQLPITSTCSVIGNLS